MDPSAENIVKKEDDKFQDAVQACPQCAKQFTKEGDLATHIKVKHPSEQQKSKPVKAQPKNRMLEMQQNEHQDIIYAYLGELGEKHQEQTNGKFDIVIPDENQKLTGQTNYSVNKVVRTPYEKQIDPVTSSPSDLIDKSRYKSFFEKLTAEINKFHEKVEAEKDKWEFRDPMAPEEETQDEFSLMDIRKMIVNYPKRGIVASYPHFSIFLLWIGRICKTAAWQQIFMIIGEFLGYYYSQKSPEEEGSVKAWEAFMKKFEEEDKNGIMQTKYEICDVKTIKKLVEYYAKWVQLFGLTKFC